MKKHGQHRDQRLHHLDSEVACGMNVSGLSTCPVALTSNKCLGRPLSILADWYYDAGIERGRIELVCLTIGK